MNTCARRRMSARGFKSAQGFSEGESSRHRESVKIFSGLQNFNAITPKKNGESERKTIQNPQNPTVIRSLFLEGSRKLTEVHRLSSGTGVPRVQSYFKHLSILQVFYACQSLHKSQSNSVAWCSVRCGIVSGETITPDCRNLAFVFFLLLQTLRNGEHLLSCEHIE